MIDAQDYESAMKKLVHDIRAKTDGAADGAPENDWILDPLIQLDICSIVDNLMWPAGSA